MPRHITTIALGIISGLIIHLYLLSSEGFTYAEMNSLGIVGCMFIGIFISYIILLVSLKLNEWVSWHQHPSSRLLSGIVINIFVAFCILSLYYQLNWNNLVHPSFEYASFGKVGMIKLGIIVTVVVIIFSIIYYALFSYNLFVSSHLQEAQLQRALIETQMNTLKGQLTPHFLFNSLNTISSLIHRDNTEAESFIRKLANTYQYTLQNYDKNWVTLEKELEVVHAYIYMMKTRFGDGLNVEVNIPESAYDIRVLPLSIQSLVENAVKHNVVDQSQPLNISIIVTGKFLIISNNKTRSPNNVISHNIGLNNLMKRYDMLTKSKIEVINKTNSFEVKIPIH